MDGKSVLAILLIVGAVGTIISTDIESFSAILRGHRTFSDPAAGQFQVPIMFGVVMFVVGVFSFVALFGLKSVLTHLSTEFSEAERSALHHLQVERAAEAAAKEREREQRENERIENLKQELVDLRTIVMSDGRKVHYGVSERSLGSILTRTTEIHVDRNGVWDEYVIIVHLLQGVAYWDIGSANYFVDDEGKDVRLLDEFKAPEVRSQLIQYEYVAGVGLESRTAADKPGLSVERANTLCTAIHNAVGDTRKTTALGMAIGKYEGEFQETLQNRENRQRSVVIIGIRTLHDSVDYQSVVKKVLNSVEISGVDLSDYSGFRLGGVIRWTTLSECGSEPHFLSNGSN